MAEKSAGRVLLIPKGVFTIGTNYTPLDFVAFGSNNYVCKKATDGTKTPVEDTASWQMLAAGFDSHNIAAEYSEEATYHTGDICISGGNLYKAKQDINAAEAFTAGHWEEITVGQELTSLETTKADASDVTTLKEKVGTTALTTTAADLSGAVNEVKAASDTNASAITKLNSDLKYKRIYCTSFGGGEGKSFSIRCNDHYQPVFLIGNTANILSMVQPNNGKAVVSNFGDGIVTVTSVSQSAFNLTLPRNYVQVMALSYRDFSVSE